MNKLAVIGGGAWGTALAQVAAKAGREVLLWAMEDDVVEAINGTHQNPIFLPGIANPFTSTGRSGGCSPGAG